ncbi:precorrin-3B synthase [Actinoplanes sp. NPDC051851]|uniref:precorrin-3B synthase n=1 Tax=Actinoplanes sp. NPDC051851 TaxID=3154753 RepID=UPI00342F4AC6
MPPLRQSDTDACPGALRLHPAADGLLARVRLPGGVLSGTRLRVLRTLAEEFGDGRLELTSRANLQLRALKAEDAPLLATRLRQAGLLPSTTHDHVRNIAAPPLAGDAIRALLPRLDEAVCADPVLARLPGKFLFALGHVPLAADIAAVPLAVTPRPVPRAVPGPPVRPGEPAGDFALRFGGVDTGLRVDAERVVEALIAGAHAFLDEREAQRTGRAAAWRLRELTEGPARVTARAAGALGVRPVPVAGAVPVAVVEPAGLLGVLPRAVGVLVPLGRLDGVHAKALEDAERLVVTPWRGVLVTDLDQDAAEGWADRLAAAGLVTSGGSRWTGVSACAGRPGCAKSLADVRLDADAATVPADGLPVHWVGCERACGSPSGTHVRVEATPAGYAVTRRDGDGTRLDEVTSPAGSLRETVAAARRRP